MLPRFAHAGFFSGIFRFFSAEESVQTAESAAEVIALPLLGSGGSTNASGVGGPIEDLGTSLTATLDSALVAPRNPTGTLVDTSHGQIAVYTVNPGDTPSSIAEQFDISLNTLLWANSIRNPNLIKTGDELIILPVSGVKYEIKPGDTIESIAKKFKGDVLDIVSFNGLAVGEPLEVGSSIIVPDGEVAPAVASGSVIRPQIGGLPLLRGYFLRPILGGRKSRGLHGFNGVDLANSCGLPVLASAEGTAIIVRSSGWNGGYGRYVVMTHPNGTQTLYAHLTTLLVSIGQRVAQGSQIATIGSTGNSTGCHIHFEIRGAKNPF